MHRLSVLNTELVIYQLRIHKADYRLERDLSRIGQQLQYNPMAVLSRQAAQPHLLPMKRVNDKSIYVFSCRAEA